MLLMPFLALSQNNEKVVFEVGLLTPNTAQINQFEKGIAQHNKKFHKEGPYGARVYWISSGPSTGSYAWVMGGFPWSALDNRPADGDGHDADWNANVLPYILPTGAQSYWELDPEVSRFGKDFTIKNLVLDYYDIKRGKYKEAMELVKKVHKAYEEKMPDETFGIYFNRFASTKEGRDMVVISFFEKMAWLGEDNKFSEKYEEKYGAGSWEKFLSDWGEVTNGGESELWIYRPDLSGINGDVKATSAN